jgi:hypothetical protein
MQHTITHSKGGCCSKGRANGVNSVVILSRLQGDLVGQIKSRKDCTSQSTFVNGERWESSDGASKRGVPGDWALKYILEQGLDP